MYGCVHICIEHMYVCVYIDMYTYVLKCSTGCFKCAHVATCCHSLPHVATCCPYFPVTVHWRELRHFCDDPVCPDRVLEAVKHMIPVSETIINSF